MSGVRVELGGYKAWLGRENTVGEVRDDTAKSEATPQMTA